MQRTEQEEGSREEPEVPGTEEEEEEEGCSPLFTACRTTEADRLEVDVANGDGGTAVMLAVRDVDPFQGIAAPGVRLPDHDGCCAPHCAADPRSPLKEELTHTMVEALNHTDAAPVSQRAPDRHSGPELDPEFGNPDLGLELESLYLNQPTAPVQQTPAQQTPAQQSSVLLYSHTGGSLLALHPRTPKLLAPLDRRPKDIAALPVLKHRVPLKPISRSPLCSRSRLRREKLSWGSPRTGLLTTKGGSEESGSSSHSSFDLEDEDEEDERDVCARASGERHMKLVGERLARRSNDVTPTEAEMVGETRQRLKVLSSISPIPPIHSPAHDLEGEPINRTHSHCEGKATNDSLIKYHYAQQGNSGNDELSITSKSQEERNRVGCTQEPGIHHGMTLHMNNDHGDAIASPEGAYRNDLQHIKQTRRTMRDSCCEESQEDDPIPCREDVKIPAGTTQETRVQLFTPAGNLTLSDMDPNGDERLLKAFKPVLNKDRRTSMNCELRVNVPTTRQTFNGLAHTDRKSKSNLKLSTQDKSKNGPELKLSGETATKVKSKLKSVKGANCHGGDNLPRKKLSDQGKRADPDKMTRAPPDAPPRELKSSRQLKRPGPAATPRSRSTVDFVAYKDVYQEMQNRDDGPAMYEIFSGPVQDNLRVSSSCEKGKGRQVQSAPPRKTQQCHKVKHRPLKQTQRRCPAESVVVSAKSKPKLMSSRVKPHAAAVPRKGPHKVRKDGHTKAEPVPSEDLGICQIRAQETALSTIEETLSRQGYETIKSNDKTLTPAASSLEDLRHPHMNMQEIRNPNRPVPELASPRSPRQPKINTWTSSCSGHTVMSPVYQKFLDEVGDGPLTDDLLQCLAEELISLDERDVSTGLENLESDGEDDQASGRKTGLSTFDHEVNFHGQKYFF
ncbi:hypothetical protein EYF80_037985 [Liparis tanakae]|uniref:Uncharacterized protein n=1 Tax=Liparis tanakae TaxID=230148 RepID=A0A4Z2GE30_9TELE|nr:hypothetical protein EYF80_037985 [Liparis tanakae]